MKNSQPDNPDESLIPAVMPTYARADIAFEKGEGVYLYDTTGRKYLDFGSGVAVNNFGFSHPHLVSALKEQADKLWHTSNLYRIPGQEKLAKRLTSRTFADTVFFTNSGAEAMECAIKIARNYQYSNGKPERYRIITFDGCFHGRTLTTIAASGEEKLVKSFGPQVDGFDHAPFPVQRAEVEKLITSETAAIAIEPVQGEGGIRPVTPECLQVLRDLADEHDLLLIFDEVQCGMGRSGAFFAHQLTDVTPDVMAIAKGIGGGFPLGACLATEKAAAGMTAGTHGSTYGGNPLATAVGNAVLDLIEEDGFMKNVQDISDALRIALVKLRSNHPESIELVRGQGLMLGLKLTYPPAELVAEALKEGLLLVAAADNTVRLLPPLIITKEHVTEAADILSKVLTTIERKHAAAQIDSEEE